MTTRFAPSPPAYGTPVVPSPRDAKLIAEPLPTAMAALGDPPTDARLRPVYERFVQCASAAPDADELAMIAEAYTRVRFALEHRGGVLGSAQAPAIAYALLLPLPHRHTAHITTSGLICPTCSRGGAVIADPCPVSTAIAALIPLVARVLGTGRLPEPTNDAGRDGPALRNP